MGQQGLSTIQVPQSSDISADLDTYRVDFLQKEESHLFVGEELGMAVLICVTNMWPNRTNGSFLEQCLWKGQIVDMVALSLGVFSSVSILNQSSSTALY